jgi:hypothetical protein
MEEKLLADVEMVLFQIHALAKILESNANEKSSPPSENNAFSDEWLTLSQIIAEKAEFCLKTIDHNLVDRKEEAAA